VSGDSAAIVIMGASGCGKSTVGTAVAQYLNCPFVEGDSLHSPENIAKMARGEALDDDDRWPWLGAVGTQLSSPGWKVASCSALKRAYRQHLIDSAHPARLYFAHLALTVDELERRLQKRTGHFWPQSLLPSQLAILERPDSVESNARNFDGSRALDDLVIEITDWIVSKQRETE
jgi:gluconokinase